MAEAGSPCSASLNDRKTWPDGSGPVSFLRKNGKSLKKAEERHAVLDQVVKLLEENLDEIAAAQEKDRVIPARFEGSAKMIIGGCKYYQSLLPEWTTPQVLEDATPAVIKGGVDAEWTVVHEPKGVCINVAPWNAPVTLSFIPTLAMLAAGNHVVIKPPELVPNVSALISRLCRKYLDGYVWAEEGGKEAVESLIDEGADHLQFTGGEGIARLVAERCGRMLTPVTLELGGKSPVFIDKGISDTVLDGAVREIIQTKVFKTGQFCCAQDYILAHEEVHDAFCKKLTEAVEALGEKRNVCMIARRQYEAVKKKLLEAGADAIPPMQGGYVPNDEDMTLPFVGLLAVALDTGVLTSEIFGPLLPILKTASVDEAIDFVGRVPTGKPLIAYCFSEDAASVDAFVSGTSSGNVVVNGGAMRAISNYMAGVGGIGTSGTGVGMWGREAMREFSNRKHVMRAKGGFAHSYFSGPPPAAPPS